VRALSGTRRACSTAKPERPRSMRASRSSLQLAAVVVLAACFALPSEPAVAQGALRANRVRPAAEAAAPSERSVAAARSVLHRLVGRWHFAIWFAGNFDGAPDATGTRDVEALYDELRVQWTEQHDDSSRSQGIIGFDSHSGRFFSSAVYSDGAGVELMAGMLDSAEPLIAFTPLAPGDADRSAMQSFTLALVDQDHFTWRPLDRSWRAVFTRDHDSIGGLGPSDGSECEGSTECQ
jgi:hypothetical protein